MKKNLDKRSLKKHLITLYDPDSAESEYFRTIKTNLELMNIDSSIQTILITSPTQDSGKTMISMNLAAIYAQCGMKTLVMDLDLRNPSFKYAFTEVRFSLGLIGLLDNRQPILLEDALVPTINENLFLLPAGMKPKSPYVILNSKKLGQIIAELKSQFDVIIIDTPPLLPVTDALIISKWVDGCILVAMKNHSRKSEIRKAAKSLYDINATLMGVVFNDMQMKSSGYGYNYIGE